MNSSRTFSYLLLSSIIAAVVLGPRAQASSCGLVLGARPITLSVLEESMRPNITELAHLQIQVDRLKGAADPMLMLMGNQLESDLQTKRDELIDFVVSTGLMTEDQWKRSFWLEVERIQNDGKSDKISEDVQRGEQADAISVRMHIATGGKFHLFAPGTAFRNVPGRGEHKIKIKKPFYLMNIPVSQYIWKRVGELIEKYLPPDYQVSSLEPSHFAGRPFNPVENVSYRDVMQWLRGLNELSRQEIPELANYFEGHQTGDEYDLPSLDQLYWASKVLVLFIPEYTVPMTFHNIGWFPSRENAVPVPFDSTFEIGTKSSLKNAGDDEFWDFFGNVYAMTNYFSDSFRGKVLHTFGGSYAADGLTHMQNETERNPDTGFRIIRRRSENDANKGLLRNWTGFLRGRSK